MSDSSANRRPDRKCCWRNGTDSSNMLTTPWSWTWQENAELCKRRHRKCLLQYCHTIVKCSLFPKGTHLTVSSLISCGRQQHNIIMTGFILHIVRNTPPHNNYKQIRKLYSTDTTFLRIMWMWSVYINIYREALSLIHTREHEHPVLEKGTKQKFNYSQIPQNWTCQA